MRIIFYTAIVLVFSFGCNKQDNFRSVVEYILINDIKTDTLDSDTVFNQTFPIIADFKLTDNEGVEQYRLEFIRTKVEDTIPDLHFLEIKSTGGLTEYIGSSTIDFDDAVIDTLPTYPIYYFITVDCFDKSGNQAVQKKNIVQIIIN